VTHELQDKDAVRLPRDHADDSDVRTIIWSLLKELTHEEFDEPDDEHTQVAVSRGDWAITVQVSGLVTLDDLSWITGSQDDRPTPSVYLRDLPNERLIPILEALAGGNIDPVLKAGWRPFDELPPYSRDFYRQ